MFMDRQKEPQFSQPVRQIVTMTIVVILASVSIVAAYPVIGPIFFSSPWLNGVIVGVFVIGILACFWQVFTLIASVNWIEGFALDRPGHEFTDSPRLMASLAALLRDAEARRSLTSTSTRSILDSVGSRLDEARDITRYIINLLIFLGLLGTFYGLATTVPAVVDTIRSLAPQEGADSMSVFDNLMSGLELQLGGMGTAFSSSLLGLAGSLIVGLLELFAGHGQNRFFSELEEWLSSITRIGFSTGDADSGATEAIAAVVEQATLQIEAMRDMVHHMKAHPTGGAPAPVANGSAVDSGVFERIAAAQDRVVQALESRSDEGGGLDNESRMRLRNIDTQLLRILEEMAAGRQDSVAELRQDIAGLAESIRLAVKGS